MKDFKDFIAEAAAISEGDVIKGPWKPIAANKNRAPEVIKIPDDIMDRVAEIRAKRAEAAARDKKLLLRKDRKSFADAFPNDDVKAIYEKFKSYIGAVHKGRPTDMPTGNNADIDFQIRHKLPAKGGMRFAEFDAFVRARGFKPTSKHHLELRSYRKGDYAIVSYQNLGNGVSYMEFAPLSVYKGRIGE